MNNRVLNLPKRVLPEAVVPNLPTLVVTKRDILAPERLAEALGASSCGVYQLAAATGLGKTVFLPQYMVRHGLVRSIVVLEPDAVIASNAYAFVKSKYTASVSLYIDGKLTGSSSNLRYSTYRDFLSLVLKNDRFVRDVEVIYIDEAHVPEPECYVLRALGLTVFLDKRVYMVSANFLETQNPEDRVHKINMTDIEYVPISKWEQAIQSKENRLFDPKNINSRVLIFVPSEREVDIVVAIYLKRITDVYSLDRRNISELSKIISVFHQRQGRPCVCVVDSHFGYGMTIPADMAIDTSLTYVELVDMDKREIVSSCVAITYEDSIQHAGRVGRVAPGRYYRMNLEFSETRELHESAMYKAYAWFVLLGIKPSMKFDDVEANLGMFVARHAKVILASNLHPLITKSYLDDDGKVYSQFFKGLSNYADPSVLELSEEQFDWTESDWFLIPGSDSQPLFAPFSLRSTYREQMIDIAKNAVDWESKMFDTDYDYGYVEPEAVKTVPLDLNRFATHRGGSDGLNVSPPRRLVGEAGSPPDASVATGFSSSVTSSGHNPYGSTRHHRTKSRSNVSDVNTGASNGSRFDSLRAPSTAGSSSQSSGLATEIIQRSSTPRPVSMPSEPGDVAWILSGLLNGSCRFKDIKSTDLKPVHVAMINLWNDTAMEIKQVDMEINVKALKLSTTKSLFKRYQRTFKLKALRKEYDQLLVTKQRIIGLQKLFDMHGMSMKFQEVPSAFSAEATVDISGYSVRVLKTLNGRPVGQSTVYKDLLFTTAHIVDKFGGVLRVSGCLLHETAVFSCYKNADLAVALRPPMDTLYQCFEVRAPIDGEKVYVLTHIDQDAWDSRLHIKYGGSCSRVSEYKWSHQAVLSLGASGCPVVSEDFKDLLGIQYSIVKPWMGGFFVPLISFIKV